jgi:peptide-methionine (R)-S-oxide reductase
MNKRVEKTEAQWREQLDPMEYQVTREAATELFLGATGSS